MEWFQYLKKDTVARFLGKKLHKITQLWTFPKLAKLAYLPWQQGSRASSPQHCCYWHHPCFPRRDGQVPRHPADFGQGYVVIQWLGWLLQQWKCWLKLSFMLPTTCIHKNSKVCTIPGDATKVLQFAMSWHNPTLTFFEFGLYILNQNDPTVTKNTPLSFWPKCSNKVDLRAQLDI